MNACQTRLLPVCFLWLTTLALLSCGNPEAEKCQAELEDIRNSLKAARAETQELKLKINRVENAVRQLNIDKEMLAAKHHECDLWAKKIIENHGAGIWYPSEFTLPVFVKSMPAASVKDIIAELNRRYAKDHLPTLSFQELARGTVIVGIDDVRHLTQQMGSSGATSYLQSAFFSITSVSGIDCVKFDFKEGDHAIPGKYCR